MTFPGGDFASDPKSDVKLPRSSPNGYGYGYGFSYDYALAKWVPVQRALVSPNGTRYAYASQDPDGGLYIVDAATSKVRDTATGAFFQIVEWRDNGIYAMKNDSLPSGQAIFHGLYLVNPDSGAVRSLSSRGIWQSMGPQAAWGYDYANPDKPATSEPVLRYDLGSGKIASFFTQPGATPSVIGFDEQDRPIADAINDVAQQIWVLNSANQGTRIYSGPGSQSTESMNFNGQGVSDSHGMWIGTNHGLMLYTTTGGFKKVSDATGQVGGGCH